MNMEDTLARVLGFITTLDPKAAALLFAISAIGEFGIFVPYVLESVWLLIGYQSGIGVLSPFYLIGLWLAAQGGRQVGSMALYHLVRFGTTPLVKFYNKQQGSRFLPKMSASSKLLNRINLSSPFSVAFGRLFGLRIPLVLILAMRKNLKALSLGVLLSSIVWDTVYISLGATVGATAILSPIEMIFASVGGLTLIYVVTFIVRRFMRRSQPEGDSTLPPPPGNLSN